MKRRNNIKRRLKNIKPKIKKNYKVIIHQTTTISFQHLIMKCLNVMTFFLIIITNNLQPTISIYAGEKHTIYLKHLKEGESCSLTNRPNGTCTIRSECVGYTPTNFFTCSLDYRTEPVICCPEHTKKRLLQLNTFNDFNVECKVDGSHEDGRLVEAKYCFNGDKLPRACPYEICSNIVCCPDKIQRRLLKGLINKFLFLNQISDLI